MAISYRTLKSVCDDIRTVLRGLSRDAVLDMICMIDYHGFWKTRLPEDFLRSILAPYPLQPSELQIEIVKVDRDLTGEIHYHTHAHAVIYTLGEAEGVEDAARALAYGGDAWRQIQSGEEVNVPPGTAHGFSVEPGGTLWFLSVQAPPIVGHQESDDYHRLVVAG